MIEGWTAALELEAVETHVQRHDPRCPPSRCPELSCRLLTVLRHHDVQEIQRLLEAE